MRPCFEIAIALSHLHSLLHRIHSYHQDQTFCINIKSNRYQDFPFVTEFIKTVLIKHSPQLRHIQEHVSQLKNIHSKAVSVPPVFVTHFTLYYPRALCHVYVFYGNWLLNPNDLGLYIGNPAMRQWKPSKKNPVYL